MDVPIRLRRIAVLLIAGVALHPACGGSTELRASDFDQSCVVDSDCTGVLDGEVCDCGPSHPAVIASSAARAFNERQSSMAKNCGSGCGGSSACLLMLLSPPGSYCARGTCAVCVDCPGADAGNEPDVGFVLGDAQTCPPPASVIPGALCAITGYAAPSCVGQIATCDGGVEATTCVCQSDAAQGAWSCTTPTPICGDAGTDDSAVDAPLDADAGD
ncbi:MAG TPA: hypothetical protein VF316_21245 [Polyangiaceae bacterium]